MDYHFLEDTITDYHILQHTIVVKTSVYSIKLYSFKGSLSIISTFKPLVKWDEIFIMMALRSILSNFLCGYLFFSIYFYLIKCPNFYLFCLGLSLLLIIVTTCYSSLNIFVNKQSLFIFLSPFIILIIIIIVDTKFLLFLFFFYFNFILFLFICFTSISWKKSFLEISKKERKEKQKRKKIKYSFWKKKRGSQCTCTSQPQWLRTRSHGGSKTKLQRPFFASKCTCFCFFFFPSHLPPHALNLYQDLSRKMPSNGSNFLKKPSLHPHLWGEVLGLWVPIKGIETKPKWEENRREVAERSKSAKQSEKRKDKAKKRKKIFCWKFMGKGWFYSHISEHFYLLL